MTDDNSPAAYLPLLEAFLAEWRGLTGSAPKGHEGRREARGTKEEPVAQRAYLLFNRWHDNPLATALEQQFPKWARDRVVVPDRQFEHRTEYAPFLLELPEELILPAPEVPGQAVRDWLARCLAFTAQEVGKRTSKQDFCGIVISPASAQAIAWHWVGLGDQRPPCQDERVLFRYHDPRVMQRVWPALSAFQQRRWLGPVTQWWSLVQPWGPFNDTSEPGRWFRAQAPVLPHGTEAGGSPRDLFDEAQWFLAGISPQAHLIWRSYADNNVPPEAQPDADSLIQMLSDAARMRLEDLNVEDYVWITWLHAPKNGPPCARDWRLPHLAPILSRIEDQLRDQPDARFSSLFAKATQSPR